MRLTHANTLRIALRVLPLLLCLGAATALASTPPTLSVCVEEAFSPDTGSGQGEPNRLIVLNQASADAHITIHYQFAPWKRCLALGRAGEVDAVAFVVPVGSNLDDFVFPMDKGHVNSSQALDAEKVMLYARRGEAIHFQGGRFSPPSVVVGARSGIKVIEAALRDSAVRYDDVANTYEVLFKKLQYKRIDIAVASQGEGDAMVAALGAQDFDKLPEPLVVAYAYLAFGKSAYARTPELAKALWEAIGKVRPAKP